MNVSEIMLIQDTREQRGYSGLFVTPCVIGTLTYGDYSVAGLEHLISVERKSLPDLLGSLTSGRERFETELKRARSLHRFYIVVECSIQDLLVEDFGRLSRAHPRAIWGTICAWSTRYTRFYLEAHEPNQRVLQKVCWRPMPVNFSGVPMRYAKHPRGRLRVANRRNLRAVPIYTASRNDSEVMHMA